MAIEYLIIVFVFGLIFGSFLNCLVCRLSKNEGFLRGSSYCPHCRHDLSFFDLIPLFSFIFLKGKCRYCGKKISWQYPLAELATAGLFLLVYIKFGTMTSLFSFDALQFLFYLVVICFFIIIFLFDLKYYIIPDEVIYPAIIISLSWIIYLFFVGLIDKTEALYFIFSALGSSLFFFLIWFFSRGQAMGFGDVKLALFLGLVLGWPNIITGLFLGFFFGAIIGLMLISMKKKGFKSEVPFGPFLVAGALISIFWGERILNWYLSLSI